ncbi:unnamed protein product [Chondrus crispus]|uniref:Uncharacterized protein n=1 Tax=Chondrus crispus TaxID=2769 RepID=R7QR33_CHOCR|nr:unnamed protein product [Chondrus crispus]CDF39845.1 unnamed protein product [Chondrus crispus]|eukprot:XP_005710139.1 unnamed protein product [Chondrus crispus]
MEKRNANREDGPEPQLQETWSEEGGQSEDIEDSETAPSILEPVEESLAKIDVHTDGEDNADSSSTQSPNSTIEQEPSDPQYPENKSRSQGSNGAEGTETVLQTVGIDKSAGGNSAYQHKSERRSRAKTFLVVFMGHSGSTAFTTELRAHSQFEVKRLEPLDHGEYQRDSKLALQKARELMDLGIANGKIPGFKIRPWHIGNMPEQWQNFVKEYDTRIIWQYRENIVKQAIGEYRHRFLNDSSVVEGLRADEEVCAKDSDQKCRIKIENMRGLHGLMNDFSSSDELLASAARKLRRDKDMSIVRYEDYLYHRERTMHETFDFLGVDYEETAPQRKKASPDSLCEMVSNFQEVCDHFLPCQLWRTYLHDPVNNCRCKPGSWKTFDSTYCRRSAWYQSKD